jgi:hypothetical protein
MKAVSGRMRFAHEAVEALSGALSALSDSVEKETLVGEAEECRRSIEKWNEHPPSSEQRERVMDRILKLHVATARLQKSSRYGTPPAEDP